MFQHLNSSEIHRFVRPLEHFVLAGKSGHFKIPKHADDSLLEIGITTYSDHQQSASICTAQATEYYYMLSGWIKYFDVTLQHAHEFTRDDFYAIQPATAYVSKAKPGTRLLSIKFAPSRCEPSTHVSPPVTQWINDPLRTVRTDYYHEASAPRPNSIHPAAAVAVEHDNTILMIRRSDNGKWTLPGGTLEFGESLPDCALREVYEETGLQVTLQGVVGTYTDGDVRIAYSDGEVRQEFTIVYHGITTTSSVVLDHESTDYQWVPLSQLHELDVTPSQRKRLDDIVDYLQTGTTRIG